MQTVAANLSYEDGIQRGLGAEHWEQSIGSRALGAEHWEQSIGGCGPRPEKFGIQTPEVNRLSCRENFRQELRKNCGARADASPYLIFLPYRGEMYPGAVTSVTCYTTFAVQFTGGIRLNRCRQLKHPACTTNPKKLESLRCLKTTNCSIVCGSAVVCIPSPSGAG